MKTRYLNTLLLAFMIVSTVFLLQACNTAKNTTALEREDISGMIRDKNFTFVAERVNPLRGRSRFLTSAYDVRLQNDSLISYLPYFGRSYSTPMDPTRVITQFTSTRYDLSVTDKDNSWNVSIKPKDNTAVNELFFSIFDNGKATLNLTRTSGDAISYTGYIKQNTLK